MATPLGLAINLAQSIDSVSYLKQNLYLLISACDKGQNKKSACGARAKFIEFNNAPSLSQKVFVNLTNCSYNSNMETKQKKAETWPSPREKPEKSLKSQLAGPTMEMELNS